MALSQRVLNDDQDVNAAWLVRKRPPEGEPPMHVVGVERGHRLWRFESDGAKQALKGRLAE